MATVPVICDNPSCDYIGDVGIDGENHIPPGSKCPKCNQMTLREQN